MSESDGIAADGTHNGQTALEVHDRVRSMILAGELDDIGPFSQVKLSEQLGVSRTPLREALRMLEHEGLVQSDPNKRTRVTAISPQDLDGLYGMRIMTECLAIFITTAKSTPDDVHQADLYMDEMSRYEAERDEVKWQVPHGSYHALLTSRAGDRLVSMNADFRDHSARYIRRHIQEPLAWMAGADEHQRIFDAFARRDSAGAAEALGLHLARTALTLVTKMDPSYDASATRGALHFVKSASG